MSEPKAIMIQVKNNITNKQLKELIAIVKENEPEFKDSSFKFIRVDKRFCFISAHTKIKGGFMACKSKKKKKPSKPGKVTVD